MRDYVKLTDVNNWPIYINSAMILTIESTHSKGSILRMVMSEKALSVKESPDDVMNLIKNVIKL